MVVLEEIFYRKLVYFPRNLHRKSKMFLRKPPEEIDIFLEESPGEVMVVLEEVFQEKKRYFLSSIYSKKIMDI